MLFAFFAFQGFLENWQNQAPSAEEMLYQADYSDAYKAGDADAEIIIVKLETVFRTSGRGAERVRHRIFRRI